VESEESALELLKALAAVGDQFERARVAAAVASDRDSAFQHLVVREGVGGLWISGALVLRRADGYEVEWTLHAENALDGSGWNVEREVLLNESGIGEPVTLGSKELPAVDFMNTADLSARLPSLVEELLALLLDELPEPLPDPQPASTRAIREKATRRRIGLLRDFPRRHRYWRGMLAR